MGLSDDRALWIADNVLTHEADLRRWLQRRRLLALEIDDIVQETYAILAGLASVEHVLNAKAYVFATAQSVVLRHVRRAKTVPIEAMRELESLADADELSPERQMAGRQELRRMAELIAALPDKCRQAVILRKVEGLSQKDIALRMGISENTVEKHVGKGVRLLMAAFADYGNDQADALRSKRRRSDPSDAATRAQRRY